MTLPKNIQACTDEDAKQTLWGLLHLPPKTAGVSAEDGFLKECHEKQFAKEERELCTGKATTRHIMRVGWSYVFHHDKLTGKLSYRASWERVTDPTAASLTKVNKKALINLGIPKKLRYMRDCIIRQFSELNLEQSISSQDESVMAGPLWTNIDFE